MKHVHTSNKDHFLVSVPLGDISKCGEKKKKKNTLHQNETPNLFVLTHNRSSNTRLYMLSRSLARSRSKKSNPQRVEERETSKKTQQLPVPFLSTVSWKICLNLSLTIAPSSPSRLLEIRSRAARKVPLSFC